MSWAMESEIERGHSLRGETNRSAEWLRVGSYGSFPSLWDAEEFAAGWRWEVSLGSAGDGHRMGAQCASLIEKKRNWLCKATIQSLHFSQVMWGITCGLNNLKGYKPDKGGTGSDSVYMKVKVLVAQSCPTLCDPMACSPPRRFCPWDSPGKNTGVGSHSLLQGIFLS